VDYIVSTERIEVSGKTLAQVAEMAELECVPANAELATYHGYDGFVPVLEWHITAPLPERG